jgi:hypothetical protein
VAGELHIDSTLVLNNMEKDATVKIHTTLDFNFATNDAVLLEPIFPWQ